MLLLLLLVSVLTRRARLILIAILNKLKLLAYLLDLLHYDLIVGVVCSSLQVVVKIGRRVVVLRLVFDRDAIRKAGTIRPTVQRELIRIVETFKIKRILDSIYELKNKIQKWPPTTQNFFYWHC
jgi:hypothetical protein